MTHSTWIAHRIGIGLIAANLALSTLLIQPAATSAGFGSSPGSHGIAAKCSNGTHFPDVVVLARKAGEGQKDFA
jgi:hypothetical protein